MPNIVNYYISKNEMIIQAKYVTYIGENFKTQTTTAATC